MTVAIMGGTGIYNLPGIEVEETIVSNKYGDACVYIGEGEHSDVVFLTRHGIKHHHPAA